MGVGPSQRSSLSRLSGGEGSGLPPGCRSHSLSRLSGGEVKARVTMVRISSLSRLSGGEGEGRDTSHLQHSLNRPCRDIPYTCPVTPPRNRIGAFRTARTITFMPIDRRSRHRPVTWAGRCHIRFIASTRLLSRTGPNDCLSVASRALSLALSLPLSGFLFHGADIAD
jgi:hypothetical protein